MANQRQIGLWTSLSSNLVAEILNPIGFDWLLFDVEHAPNDVPLLLGQLQAMRGSPSEPVVRPEWNDPVIIKRLLDIGFRSFLVPMVQNAEEAAAAVAATRYPPEGIRGVATVNRAAAYGADVNYFKSANSQACVTVQIETRESVDNLEAISNVEGVDGVFVGPSDLAASFGHLGNPSAPAVQEAIQHVVNTARNLGKAAGTLAPARDDAMRYLDWGFSFVAVGADIGLLRGGASQLLASYRE
ncbi:MAG: aldolase/citrate lyase family protein [Rhodospirillales bacterium]|nr:aldolase/citrate lyase family protein [Rhodospirillales bacterium]